MLQLHKDLALQMGMDRKNIVICDNGDAVEIGARSMKCVPGYAPAGEVFVDGYGVGDVGAVVLRDRKHLAEDGMVVVVLPISAQNGDLLGRAGDHHARLYLRQGFRGTAARPQKPHDVHGGGLPRQARGAT